MHTISIVFKTKGKMFDGPKKREGRKEAEMACIVQSEGFRVLFNYDLSFLFHL